MLCPLLWPSQNRLMLTSKELIPLSESHMTSCCSKTRTWTCGHTDIVFIWSWTITCSSWCCELYSTQWYTWLYLAKCAVHTPWAFGLAFCWVLSPVGSACVECFALVWHHSFRVDNLRGADYSLGQRKHTAFYWLTAVKLLLCRRLIFAGISKWNIS